MVANAISVALSDISKPEAEAEKKSDLSEDSEEVELQPPQPHLIDHNYAAASAPEEELASIKGTESFGCKVSINIHFAFRIALKQLLNQVFPLVFKTNYAFSIFGPI